MAFDLFMHFVYLFVLEAPRCCLFLYLFGLYLFSFARVSWLALSSAFGSSVPNRHASFLVDPVDFTL